MPLVSLRNVRSGGRTYAAAEPFIIKGESHTKSNGADVMIGAVAGGGKGAVIGAGVGAATGTGVAAATGKKPAEVESEAVLTWVAANHPGAGPQGERSTCGGHGGDRDETSSEFRSADYKLYRIAPCR